MPATEEQRGKGRLFLASFDSSDEWEVLIDRERNFWIGSNDVDWEFKKVNDPEDREWLAKVLEKNLDSHEWTDKRAYKKALKTIADLRSGDSKTVRMPYIMCTYEKQMVVHIMACMTDEAWEERKEWQWFKEA